MRASGLPKGGQGQSREISLANFLQHHPEIEFDLEEYVFSTRFRQALRRRLDGFAAGMNSRFETAIAEKRLLAKLRSGAVDWVPAYQGYRRKSNLRDLPLIEKQDVRKVPQKYLAANYPVKDLFLKTTTGSSGVPFPVWHSAAFYFDGLLLAVQKAAIFLQRHRTFRRAVFCLAVSDDRAKKDFVTLDPTNRAGLLVRVTVDEQNPASYDRVMKLIADHRPACVSSKPSILEVLASRMRDNKKMGIPAFLISSGAKLGSELRANLTRLFKCQVTEAYGLTEFGVVAYPCFRNNLHVDTSAAYLEIVDDSGERLPNGKEGEIVISSLANEAMPLLRYRTGDLGTLSGRACRCGSPAPVLASVAGRIVRSFELPSGRRFAPTYFNDLFRIFPFLKEFQITQAGASAFDVRLEPNGQVKGTAKKLELVRGYIERSLPERVIVRGIQTVFPRDDKFQRFRSSL